MNHFVLFILLGCNVNEILYDRIDTAVQFASELNNATHSTQIDWYLSGGIKNDIGSEVSVSEAVKMNQILSQIEVETDNWDYILDTHSTNTAENFVLLKGLVESKEIKRYSDVYVITSEFHYHRAKKIANQIIPNNTFKWLLGKAELQDSNYWESIHTKNVEVDVSNAFNRYQVLSVATL